MCAKVVKKNNIKRDNHQKNEVRSPQMNKKKDKGKKVYGKFGHVVYLPYFCTRQTQSPLD